MREKKAGVIVIKSFALLVVLGVAHQTMAQNGATTYTKMAPVEQYLMADRDEEIALARSAAPESISCDAGKQGYGGASAPHWPPHLMFFYSDTDPAIWGANLPGSPIIAVSDPLQHLTQFVIPTQRWSDGTEYLPSSSHSH